MTFGLDKSGFCGIIGRVQSRKRGGTFFACRCRKMLYFSRRGSERTRSRKSGGPSVMFGTFRRRGLFKGSAAACRPGFSRESPRAPGPLPTGPCQGEAAPGLLPTCPCQRGAAPDLCRSGPCQREAAPALCKPAPAKEESFAGAEAAENSGDFSAPLGLSGREDFSRPSRRCSARYPCRRRGYGRGLREKDEIFRESTFYDNKTRLKTVLFFGSFARLWKGAFADTIRKRQIFRLLLAVQLQIRR